MNKTLSADELRANILSFLKEHKSGSLATCMNHVPRSSPIQYFMGNDLDIYIVSAGGSKFDAINQNPNVCLLVNTEYINYRKIKGVQVFGVAHTAIPGSSIYDEARTFSPDPHIFDSQDPSVGVIKIIPQEIVYLDSLKDGDRTKQILRDKQVMVKEDRDHADILTNVH